MCRRHVSERAPVPDFWGGLGTHTVQATREAKRGLGDVFRCRLLFYSAPLERALSVSSVLDGGALGAVAFTSVPTTYAGRRVRGDQQQLTYGTRVADLLVR